MGRFAGILIGAWILDLCLGDPRQWPHPVCYIGTLITFLEKKLRRFIRADGVAGTEAREKRAGLLLVILVVTITLGIVWLLLALATLIHPNVKIGLEIWFSYRLLAIKSLKTESMNVYQALKSGTLEEARHAVAMIVGRDTDQLSEKGVIKATVETIAENTSDGVIAPLLFLAIFGVFGIFFYKAVNTMDSMIGYQNDQYRNFGMIAAKLDDFCNFVPARLAAMLMIVASALLKYHPRSAVRIYRRDRKNHKSPNSGQTEAVCAGALQIQLAGNAWYFGTLIEKPTIGDDLRLPELEDINRANRLLYLTSFLAVILLIWI